MKILTTIALSTLTMVSYAQPNLDWAFNFGATLNDQAREVLVDSNDDVILIGDFSGTFDADPGAGQFNLTPSGSQDIYIIKIDANQNLQWAKSIGGTGNINCNGAEIDSDNSIYITGYFQATVDFDPGANTSNLTSNGGNDGYVLKLNTSGEFLWVNQIGGSDNDVGRAVGLDGDINVNATGYITNGTSQDIYVCQYDSSGTLNWYHEIGGNSNDYGAAVACDTSNNVYFGGAFRTTVDFDPSGSVSNLTVGGAYDSFILKLNQAGQFQWVKQLAGSSVTVGGQIREVVYNGDLYCTGTFDGETDFDPGVATNLLIPTANNGYADIFICVIDESGSYVNAVNIGGDKSDTPLRMIEDGVGNILISGNFEGTADFDPSANQFQLIENGTSNGDIFLAKYSSNLDLVWAFSHGDTGPDLGWGIAQKDNVLYTTGIFSNTVDFDPGSGTNNLTSNGGTDCYVQKFNHCAVDVSVNTIDEITMQANFSTGTYQWVNCDENYSAINGETNQSFTATANGNYAVIVTSGTCSDTSDCVNINKVGLDEMINDISIYPNPTNNVVNISVPTELVGSQFSIRDFTGRTILYNTFDVEHHEIDLSTYDSGIYFIHVNEYNITFRLVKE